MPLVIAGAGRFRLTVRLLNGKAKGAAAQLLQAVHGHAVCAADDAAVQQVQALCCHYGCSNIGKMTASVPGQQHRLD